MYPPKGLVTNYGEGKSCSHIEGGGGGREKFYTVLSAGGGGGMGRHHKFQTHDFPNL